MIKPYVVYAVYDAGSLFGLYASQEGAYAAKESLISKIVEEYTGGVELMVPNGWRRWAEQYVEVRPLLVNP